MKAKVFITMFGMLAISMLFAQSLQKQYYENNLELGGDVVINSSKMELVNTDEIRKTFEIESPTDGTFYLDAWLSAPFTPEGCPEYGVMVNNVILSATFKPQTSGWGSIALTDLNKSTTTIKLKKGLNSIAILGKKFEVPNVEHIKLSSSAINTNISDSKYKAYIESIKANTLDLSPELVNLATDSIPPYTTLPRTATNGEIYTYQLNMPVPYTTTYLLYYEAGTTVNINVTQSNNYEYVIEFFDTMNFTDSWLSNSWSKYCKGSSSLSIVIPQAAFYLIRLRAYRQMSAGLADLRINDKSYPSSPISGNGISFTGSSSQTEVFTCYSPYQMYLFLEGAGLPGIIREYKLIHTTWPNGKYGCRLSLPNLAGVGAGLISGVSSSDPVYNADLYLGLSKVSQNTLNFFPNLKSGESYGSASINYDYNCISWTVGITTEWIFPSETSLEPWDAFYNSYGYTRTGANADNAAIAVWKNGTTFTHASVRKNSTIAKPHGFDWESKCGSLERVMHFRDALSGNSYGSIAYYYRPINGTVNAWAASSEITQSTFSSADLNTLETLKMNIPSHIISEFNVKYTAWKATWTDPEIAANSNPRKYAESKEYSELSRYCQQYGKTTWPLFIDKLAAGDVFVCNLLEDLTFTTKENKELYKEAINIKSRGIGIPSPFIYSNMIEYSKRLLIQENNNIRNSIQNIAEIEPENCDINITTTSNDIILAVNTQKVTSILINIYNTYGISIYKANYSVSNNGWQTTISTSAFNKGTYMIQITVDNKTISRKINI